MDWSNASKVSCSRKQQQQSVDKAVHSFTGGYKPYILARYIAGITLGYVVRRLVNNQVLKKIKVAVKTNVKLAVILR